MGDGLACSGSKVVAGHTSSTKPVHGFLTQPKFRVRILKAQVLQWWSPASTTRNRFEMQVQIIHFGSGGVSSTSRTFRTKPSVVNGLERNAVLGSRTPWWTMASSV